MASGPSLGRLEQYFGSPELAPPGMLAQVEPVATPFILLMQIGVGSELTRGAGGDPELDLG